MQLIKDKNYKDGWFIGNFRPSAYKTKDFEVAFKKHQKGEFICPHTHYQVIEINYLIRGKMEVNNKLVHSGEVFIIEKGEMCTPIFLEDCELIVVKTPSIPGDKFEYNS